MTEEMNFKELVDEAKQSVEEITVEATAEALQGADAPILLDIREDGEFAAGHAAGARHLGRGVIERDAHKLLPDRAVPIIAYCGGGSRSALAAHTLGRMGYTNVKSMIGGIRAWQEKGLPMES